MVMTTRKTPERKCAEQILIQLGIVGLEMTRKQLTAGARISLEATTEFEGERPYFHSIQALRKVLSELKCTFGGRFEAKSEEKGIIRGEIGDLVGLIHDAANRIGVPVIQPATITSVLGLMEGRIRYAMQRQTALKSLNAEYRKTRLSQSAKGGKGLPAYKDWVLAQVVDRLNLCSDPVLLKTLGF